MNVRVCVAVLLAFYSLGLYAEPLGTGFTYQGELKQAGQPASGLYDFQFELYDVLNGGISIVTPVVIDDVQVADGIFTVELDFGSDVFDGTQLWIETGVREGALTGSFSTLSPRQKLTATPYALHSFTAGGGAPGSPERSFVGYTSDTITTSSFDQVWWEASQLCASEFGVGTAMATSEEIRAAIDANFFFFPTGAGGIIRPVDLIPFGNSFDDWYEPHLNRAITNNSALEIIIAGTGTQFSNTNVIQGMKVACSQ